MGQHMGYLRAVSRAAVTGVNGKRKMLGEFCANTGYNRKYALRLLNGPPPGRARSHRAQRRPTYGQELVPGAGGSTFLGPARVARVGQDGKKCGKKWLQRRPLDVESSVARKPKNLVSTSGLVGVKVRNLGDAQTVSGSRTGSPGYTCTGKPRGADACL